MVSRELRPTTTFAIQKADQKGLLQRLQAIGGAELSPGPYEFWRVKLSEGTSQATAIMYRSGKLVLAGHAPAFDHAIAITEAVGKPLTPRRTAAHATTAAAAEVPLEQVALEVGLPFLAAGLTQGQAPFDLGGRAQPVGRVEEDVEHPRRQR